MCKRMIRSWGESLIHSAAWPNQTLLSPRPRKYLASSVLQKWCFCAKTLFLRSILVVTKESSKKHKILVLSYTHIPWYARTCVNACASTSPSTWKPSRSAVRKEMLRSGLSFCFSHCVPGWAVQHPDSAIWNSQLVMFQLNLGNCKAHSGHWYTAYLLFPSCLSAFLKSLATGRAPCLGVSLPSRQRCPVPPLLGTEAL